MKKTKLARLRIIFCLVLLLSIPFYTASVYAQTQYDPYGFGTDSPYYSQGYSSQFYENPNYYSAYQGQSSSYYDPYLYQPSYTREISDRYKPIYYTPYTDYSKFRDERDVGEAIAINVRAYEPPVVTSNLVEEEQIPVFVFLEGFTAGSLLGMENPSIEPLYGAPVISRIDVRPMEYTKGISSIRHVPPANRQYSLNDLGYLIVYLSRTPKEEDVPKAIDADLKATVWFDTTLLRDIGEDDLILPQESDEQAWKDSVLPKYSFWGGRGYIRAVRIGTRDATLEIYDGNLRSRGVFTLNLNEISSPVFLNYASDLMENQFRVMLTDILDPSATKAQIRVSVDGNFVGVKSLTEGQALYPGSDWHIVSISKAIEGGRFVNRVLLQNSFGSEAMLSQTTKEGDYFTARLIDSIFGIKKFKDLENLKFDGGIKIEVDQEIGEELISKDYPQGLDFSKDALLGDTINRVLYLNKETFTSKLKSGLFPKRSLDFSFDDANKELKIFERKQETKETILDPCSSPRTLQEQNYCRAIESFKEIIARYPDVKDRDGILFKDKAYFWLGKTYDELAKSHSASITEGRVTGELEALSLNAQKLAEDYYSKTNFRTAQTRASELGDAIMRGLVSKPILLEDFGRTIDLELVDIEEKDVAREPTASIEIIGLGTDTLKPRDDIFKILNTQYDGYDTIAGNKLGYKWRVFEIGPDYVVVEKYYLDDPQRRGESLRITKRISSLEGRSIRVIKTDLKKQAKVSVIPGSGRDVYSESNFSIHIPIEKRAIDLTPEKIEKKIESTKKKLEQLDKIVDKMDNVLTAWKGSCLGLYALLTIKNSFFNRAQVKARQKALNEVPLVKDGKSYNGWSEYCRENVAQKQWQGSKEKAPFSTYDDCISANSAQIEADTKKIQMILEKTNNELKTIKNWDDEGWKKFAEVNKDSGLSEEDTLLLKEYDGISIGEAQELIYLKNTDSALYKKKISDYENEISTFKNVEEKLKKLSIDKTSTDYFLARNQLLKKEKEGQDVEVTILVGTEEEKLINELGRHKIENKKTKAVQISSDIIGAEGNQYFIDSTRNKVFVEPLKTEKGESIVYQEMQYFKEKGADKIYIVKINNVLPDTCHNMVYKEQPAIQIDPRNSNKPWLVPLQGAPSFSDAAYLEIKYSSIGKEEFRIWNVGLDGEMQTNDDCPLFSPEKLGLPGTENVNARRVAQQAYDTASRYNKKGRTVNLFGKNYVVDDSKVNNMIREEGLHCADVMEPSDCKLLFGVCDPVMCPISRFNLNGRWQLQPGQSVPATGIIGSSVLGLHLFSATEPVPVCLTGILAGLKNIRSIFQSYLSCLNTARVRGEAVGVCDKIRSIFTCQVLWQEGIAILKLFKFHGRSIVGILSGQIFDKESGGNEYLSFESSIQNLEDSVKFFTQDYAESAFAAFQAKSTAEVGTEICQSAIYGKVPGMGDMIDQLTAPEDPPQFTAVLSETPYAEIPGEPPKSQYNIFYHIYGGTKEIARWPLSYSVFIKDPFGRIRWTTERCDRRRGRIDKGGFASFSLDCIYDFGFTEICIELAGKTECGFGKVTSEFALDWLNDQLVKKELQKEIKSEEACISDARKNSPSISNLAYGALGRPGILNTGLSRVCSVNNPGSGSDSFSHWQIIGDCGKDKLDRSLGFCWLDTRTISINNVETYSDILSDIQERGYKYQPTTSMVTKQNLDSAYSELSQRNVKVTPQGEISQNGVKVTTKEQFEDLLRLYEILARHYDINVAAEAQFIIGIIYFNLANQNIQVEKSNPLTTEEQVRKEFVQQPQYECISGLCCANGALKPIGTVCQSDIAIDYECTGSGYGADLVATYTSRLCSGNSENCDGELKTSEKIIPCKENEICSTELKRCVEVTTPMIVE